MMQRCGFPSEPSLGAESDKVLWFVVLTICLVGCALVALLGRLHPDIVPDTASYFRVGALPDSLAQPRTPVYMWLTGPLYFNGFVALVPWLHLAAFVSATLLLAWQSKLSGLSRTGVVSICLAAMTSTALFKITNEIVPESLAPSFGLASVAATLWAARSQRPTFPQLAIFAACGACYLLRPIYLPLMVALPALFHVVGGRQIKRTATLAVFLAAALPFLLFSSVRLVLCKDFNVVSFGGYQASAIASFMLTPELIARLPKDEQSTASKMLMLRMDAEQHGEVARVPKKTDGTRSFGSSAIAFPDYFVGGYDPVLNRNMTKRGKHEAWVAFNARLMKVDLALFKADPVGYAEWVVGVTARFLGHAIIINPSMLIALALLLLSRLPPVSIMPHASGNDVKLLTTIALAWLFSGGLLSVAASFPAQRYIDSSSVLLSSIPFYFFVGFVERLFVRRRVSA